MNTSVISNGRKRIRSGIAVAAAALLVTGVAWGGLTAGENLAAADQTAAKSNPPIARAMAAGTESYAGVVNNVMPAVVTVRVEGKSRVSPTAFPEGEDFFERFFGEQFGGRMPQQREIPRTFRQRGLGSGVIVSSDGYVLTNFHVVDGADDIRLELSDGRTLKGKIVGTDKPSDLALLKVEATNLSALPLGNSDVVNVGDVVLAVGNPLGIGQTVTMGIISAKGRSTSVGDGSYEDFLQTDAPINHGNSGGALVNTKGELVGINSQIASVSDGNIGIGFAIPANMARHVMDELKSGGKVRRAQLGVSIQPVTSDMAESLGLKQVGGVIVSSVEPGSAADHAGIKRGDVIMSFNGQAVKDLNALRNRVAETAPGSAASVSIVRDGGEKTLNVKLDEASASKTARNNDAQSEESDQNALGVSVAPLTPDLASRAKVPNDVKGVMVQDVDPEGRAAQAGIQSGDVIQEVNREQIQTADELKAAVRKTTDRPLLLLVNREGRDLFVTVRPA